MDIRQLNETMSCDVEELDALIAELDEREELACTGNVCRHNTCGVNPSPSPSAT